MDIKDLVTFEVNGKKCVAFVRKLTGRTSTRSSSTQHRSTASAWNT